VKKGEEGAAVETWTWQATGTSSKRGERVFETEDGQGGRGPHKVSDGDDPNDKKKQKREQKVQKDEGNGGNADEKPTIKSNAVGDNCTKGKNGEWPR